jgi:CRP-like cAMP-binding protein
MTAVLTLLEKTVCMKSTEVFAAIPTEALARLAARATEMRVDRGQALFHERDDDQGIFIVVEGAVELRKDDVVVRQLGEGAVHGELFLQENESQQYTAIAGRDARVLKLGRRDVFHALYEHPEFAVAMVRDLALRHHRLTERVIELEQQVASGAPVSERQQTLEEIESPPPRPALPKWRAWWRLARTTPKQ